MANSLTALERPWYIPEKGVRERDMGFFIHRKDIWECLLGYCLNC